MAMRAEYHRRFLREMPQWIVIPAGKVRPAFAEENARETDSGHGCPFASSCGYAMKCCFEGTPELYRFGSRETACFLYSEEYSGKRADGYRMTSQI